jgi:hypothetical protein
VTLLNRRINQGGGQSTFTVTEGGFHVYVGVPLDTGGALDRAAATISRAEPRC